MAGGTAIHTDIETWTLDAAHSSVEFAVKHMMMTTVRGRFKAVSATLTGNEDHPEGCCVEVMIDAASVDTGSPDRDTHLRSADFFDVQQYPHMLFKSGKLEGKPQAKEGARFQAEGNLTIRDATFPVTLDCTFEGRGKDPWGKERVGFSASAEIDRRDWGLKWNAAIETGGVLVANKVRIDVEVQFVKEES